MERSLRFVLLGTFTLRFSTGLTGAMLGLYLASLPGLTRTFAASVATVQLTLSVFVITFGVMQLAIGPLSDRLGRYPVTLAGIAVYVVASIACALAPSIEMLILARLAQAVGTPSTSISTNDEPEMNANRPPYEAAPTSA